MHNHSYRWFLRITMTNANANGPSPRKLSAQEQCPGATGAGFDMDDAGLMAGLLGEVEDEAQLSLLPS